MKYQQLLEADNSLQLHFVRDEQVEISSLTTLEYIKEGHLIFIKNGQFFARYLDIYKRDKSQLMNLGVVLDQNLIADLEIKAIVEECAPFIFLSPQVELSMVRLSKIFYDEKYQNANDLVDGRQMGTVTLHPTAWVAQNVFIGANVTIDAGVKIYSGAVIMSHSHIKEGAVIYPNVTIYSFVEIGKGVRIHSGTVIGADGFGYQVHQGVHEKIWHFGGVIIEDGVEIGANATIDTGTFAPTKVGRGTKIDNQVQIGHNCQVGPGCIFCGQSGLAGSVKLGAYCVLGGKAGIAPDARLGDQSQIAGGSLVAGVEWPAKSILGGHPARKLSEWMRGVAYLRKVSSGDK